MVSDPNQDKPNDSTGDAAARAREVDDVLAQAAGLTAELEAELGASPAEVGPAKPDPADVDQQLNKVESLLKGVQSGGEAPDADQPLAGDQSQQAGDGQEGEEQTAAADQAPEPDDAEPPDACDGDPDGASDSDLQSHLDELTETPSDGASPPPADPPSPTSDASAQTLATPDVDPRTSSTDDAPTPSPADVWFARLRRVRESVVRAAGVLVDVSLAAIEAIDRPFMAVSYRVRCWLGWLAMAILSASLAVIAFSWS